MDLNHKHKSKNIEYKDSFAHYIEQELKEPLEVYWDFNKNTYDPRKLRRNSTTKVWIKCKKHSYHNSYQMRCYSFLQGKRCPYCCNKKVNYFDSLGFLYFEIAKLIVADDQGNKVRLIDTYNIPPYTNNKYILKCNKCGHEIIKKLKTITPREYHCNRCYDGKSFGEKFIFYLLKTNNISLVNKMVFEWGKEYRYDFYLSDHNTIIEINGLSNNNLNKKRLDEIKNMNLTKKNLAINNGIVSYITINYNVNNKKSIEKAIVPALNDIISLDNIDLKDIYKKANESLIFEVSKSWNRGKSTLDISKELSLSRSTICKYLKKGNEIGIVTYNPKSEMKYNAINISKNTSKKVICKTTGEIFNSQLEAAKAYDISPASIISCCKGRTSYGGKEKDTGKKLVWSYY